MKISRQPASFCTVSFMLTYTFTEVSDWIFGADFEMRPSKHKALDNTWEGTFKVDMPITVK